ncbi:MAG: spermidine/putrescine ABC transporter substrate-binding protein [Acidimicrobiales bacterium]
MNLKLIGTTMVLLLAASACGGSDDGGGASSAAADCKPGETDGDLSFYNWADYMDEDLISQFEDETGISVDYSIYASNEEMLAQVDANAAVYDLVVPSDYMVDTMRQEDLLIELNFDAIPNAKNIGSEWDAPPFDSENKFHVPYQWGTTGIGISYEALEALGDPEPTWGFIFDPELSSQIPGGIAMLDDAPEAVSAALKYLGYSINDVMTNGNEDAIREAGELLKETRDRLVKYDSITYADDLVNGEVGASHGWSGGFALSLFEADAYETHVYVIPKEGAVRWVDTMAIPVTAEHPCSAHAMINFLTDAQNGATLTNFVYYASPNEAATEFILPEILEDPGIYPTAEVKANLEFIPQAGDLGLLIQDVFTESKG